MGYQRIDLLLKLAILTGLIGIVSCLFLCVYIPLDTLPETATTKSSPADDQPTVQLLKWSLRQFDQALEKPLQRQVFDETLPRVAEINEQTASPPKAKPIVNLRLLGTVVDSDNQKSRAWLKLPNGNDLMLGIGQRIEGLETPAQIRTISPKCIVLDLDGIDQVLVQLE